VITGSVVVLVEEPTLALLDGRLTIAPGAYAADHLPPASPAGPVRIAGAKPALLA
jgi:hypothetical protein